MGRFPFQANGKVLGTGDYSGWAKIVMDETYGEILGAHAAEGMPMDIQQTRPPSSLRSILKGQELGGLLNLTMLPRIVRQANIPASSGR